jgi:UDP-N-acetylglucosamine diphosphorylase / glucose-1-phosphate thymidylyltransferase / UDP-N-acetylgalactosamine diphosphorylase / glucosamine-1-phosphate N-acetyltransferase / galactosamine-1-phosphate N-acetyltransferase
VNIVVPMAGRGSRFAQVGYTVPKPLIDVRGRPMYAWAVQSLPLGLGARLIFICLREHEAALAPDVKERYARHRPVLRALDGVTAGQACTVLAVRDLIDNDQPLIIYNADTYCRTGLEPRLRAGDRADGILSVFEAPGDKWSFARADAAGRVVETAEKRRISEWATTGLYYFARGRDFVRHADAAVAADERVNGEFYVAPLYNRMIREGADVRLDVAPEVWVLGTPEDLAHFEANYPR